MENENKDTEKKSEEPKHHQSWLGHIIEVIKEEFEELKEEAVNMNGGFPVGGRDGSNVVHTHHHTEEKQGDE